MADWPKSLTWKAAVLFVIALISFFFTWAFISRHYSKDSSSVEGLALVCEEPNVDLGEIAVPRAEHRFTLHNPCSRELRITKLGKSCNCLDPELERMVIPPGDSSTVSVTVRVNPKHPGQITRFRERLYVHCDEQDDRLSLEVYGTYIPYLYYEKLQINLIAPENIGEPFTGNYDVFLRRKKDLDIKELQVRNIACKTYIRSRNQVGKGDFDKVVIDIQGKLSDHPLPQTGSLVIQTSSEAVPTLQIPIVLYNPRAEEINIEPPRIALGIIASGKHVSRQVAVHMPADAGYEIEGPVRNLVSGTRFGYIPYLTFLTEIYAWTQP